MSCFRLRARAATACHRRVRCVRSLVACATAALAFWLVACGSTVTAYPDPPPPPPGGGPPVGANMAPHFISFYGYYQSFGYWCIRGQVWDEHPAGMQVQLEGGPLPENRTCTVQEDGTFTTSVQILGSGVVFANTTDYEGLAAPEVFTYIGL